MKPLNLIYITKEPIFVHIYQPPTDGDEISQTLWFGLEPQLTDEEENVRRELIETLLKEAPSAPNFTTDEEFENILSGMIDRYTVIGSGGGQKGGRIRQLLGMDDEKIGVTREQRERLRYTIIRDLVRNGPLEPLLSDEMLEDIVRCDVGRHV